MPGASDVQRRAAAGSKPSGTRPGTGIDGSGVAGASGSIHVPSVRQSISATGSATGPPGAASAAARAFEAQPLDASASRPARPAATAKARGCRRSGGIVVGMVDSFSHHIQTIGGAETLGRRVGSGR